MARAAEWRSILAADYLTDVFRNWGVGSEMTTYYALLNLPEKVVATPT
jgi:hypothetical protein